MTTALKALFASKKTWMLVLGIPATVCASLLAKYGLDLSDEAVEMTAELMSIGVAVLIAAQGVADHGKSAALIKAVAPDAPVATQTVNVNTEDTQP